MGRPVIKVVCTPLNCGSGAWALYYGYDLAGDMTSYTVPTSSPVTITQAFDGARRLSQVTSSWSDSYHPSALFTADSSVGYFPHGELRKAALGNGLTLTNVFNSRLQPCLIDVNSSNVTLGSCSDGTPTGNKLDLWMGYNEGSSDNGNVINWNATGYQSFVRTYGYDSLNRVSTMSDSVSAQPCQGLSWTYDPYGNRTDQNVTSGTCNTFHQSIGTNNRLTSSPYTYDAAGNMTHDASHSYTYDAENRITQVDGGSTATYVYDAEGFRVRTNVGSVTTDFMRDLSGNIVSAVNPSWDRSYIRANGTLLAEYSEGTTYFVHPDHLGSTRLLTAPDQSVRECDDYYPYGEIISCGSTTASPLKFDGKEHDSESNLDDFGARYYTSGIGRFMIPDWDDKATAVPFADFGNPQSLNLYAYVKNNPMSYADQDGHCTSNGDQKGFWWCLFHYSDQDALREARSFFNNNAYYQNGSRVDPSKLTDQQLLAAWKNLNDQWKALVAAGANPGVGMAATQFGFPGQQSYNDAVRQLNRANTPEGTIDNQGLGTNNKIPTQNEATSMIEESGGTVDRIEEGHGPDSVSHHDYPHINYHTSDGTKGTIRIQKVEQ